MSKHVIWSSSYLSSPQVGGHKTDIMFLSGFPSCGTWWLLCEGETHMSTLTYLFFQLDNINVDENVDNPNVFLLKTFTKYS